MSSRKVYCGVPVDQCNGQQVTLNALWQPDGVKNKKSGKLHSSHEEAFSCHCRHLVSIGYKRVGQREFESPHGPILVLDKKSHFGSEFRKGKEGDKSSSRFTPMRGRGAIVESAV